MLFSPFRLYSGIVKSLREELLQLTPVYQQVENGWTQATLVELPGVITAAPSREEAQELLLDALREFLLSFGPGPMSVPMNADPDALTLTISVQRNPAA
jgi:predicted RNase H-like HicB family nuclease